MSEPAVVVKGLVKRYGETVAVAGIDLEVRRGECFGLLGPNGAGKTTTVEVLEGLHEADGGEVVVLGKRWSREPQRLRELIGVALQETQLQGRLTCEETVDLFASFYPRPRPALDVLAEVDLVGQRAVWVEQLSGGQKQRLALALALVHAPELVFLDEPTTGLDPRARRETWALLSGLKGRGTTLLLTTHFMDEAEALCDRVAVVDKGKVIALGTPAELVRGLGGEAIIEVESEPAPDEAALKALDGVKRVEASGKAYRLIVGKAHEVVPRLLAGLEQSGRKLLHLSTRSGTLEDVFLQLTGRRLDGGPDGGDQGGEPKQEAA